MEFANDLEDPHPHKFPNDTESIMPMRAELSIPATHRNAASRSISGILRSSDLLIVLVVVIVGLVATLLLLLSPFSVEIAAVLGQLS